MFINLNTDYFSIALNTSTDKYIREPFKAYIYRTFSQGKKDRKYTHKKKKN